MHIVCYNEDILTGSSSVCGNHWSNIVHTLAYCRHLLRGIRFLHLSINLLLSLLSVHCCILALVILVQSDEDLSLFNRVVTT